MMLDASFGENEFVSPAKQRVDMRAVRFCKIVDEIWIEELGAADKARRARALSRK